MYIPVDIDAIDWAIPNQIHKCPCCGKLMVMKATDAEDKLKARDCRRHGAKAYQKDLIERDFARTYVAQQMIDQANKI